MQGHVYRNFHNGKCYELDIRIASSNIGNYGPGTVKSCGSETVRHTLNAVLATFSFVP